ncbi:MAG: hypothetical protein ACRCW9_09695 [Cetobacterium sp.]
MNKLFMIIFISFLFISCDNGIEKQLEKQKIFHKTLNDKNFEIKDFRENINNTTFELNNKKYLIKLIIVNGFKVSFVEGIRIYSLDDDEVINDFNNCYSSSLDEIDKIKMMLKLKELLLKGENFKKLEV